MGKWSWIFVLFFVAGIFIIYYAVNDMIDAFNSSDWPSVDGEIISNEVVERFDSDDSDYYYIYEIDYHYTINGERYTGNRISYEGGVVYYDFEEAEAFVEQNYPLGKMVNVYFDPDNPTECTLETGFGFISIPILLMGLLFTIIPLFAWYSLKRRRFRIG